ncbi:MAG: hypothetical protein ACXWF8_09730 [Methylobacter sp.]
MTLIASGQDTPVFHSVSKKTKKTTRHYVAAWNIGDHSIDPILYPYPPKDSVVFLEERNFVTNVATGDVFSNMNQAAQSVG